LLEKARDMCRDIMQPNYRAGPPRTHNTVALGLFTPCQLRNTPLYEYLHRFFHPIEKKSRGNQQKPLANIAHERDKKMMQISPLACDIA
jgi:hypothetical protein